MGSKKHGLQIIDSDAHFTVDPITRNITNDESTKNTILQGDHNSERFTFKIPRYIDGHDMSTCDNVRVAYINTEVSGRDKKHGTGVYLVSDLAVDPSNDKFVTCSWLISRNATMYTGVLNFMLIFSCMDGELVKYRWKTNIFESIYVALSLDADLIFEAEYLDVIEQWKDAVKNEFSVYLEDSAKQHYGEFKDVLHEEMAAEFDVMQEDLDEKIEGFDTILKTEITNMDGEIDTLKSRMDTFTSLPEGSTTGDAELADIRVGSNGATYPNAGDAVRIQMGQVTNYANTIGYAAMHDSGATFDGIIELTADEELFADKTVVYANIPGGTTYDVTYICGLNPAPTGSLYEQYDDGTRSRVIDRMAADTKYSLTAKDNVVGLSMYMSSDSITSNAHLGLKIVTHVYNDNSIEDRVLGIEKGDRVFMTPYITSDDVEYGAIEDGTGVDIRDGETNRKRTKTFIRMAAGSHVKCPTNVNVWEYDFATHEYIRDNGAWTTDYTVQNDCLIRIMWMVSGDEDVLEKTEIEYAKQIKDIALPVVEHAIWEAIPSMTIKSISHRGRYGVDVGAMCCKSAMVAARKQGYQYIENDVNISKDGHLVMWHDSDLSRIGDYEHGVGDYTLAELKAMDFGSYAGFPGEKILTFAEWVLCAKELGMDIYVDFKIAITDAQAEEMVQTVRRYGMLKNTSWLGNHGNIRKHDPAARIGVLSNPNAHDIAVLAKYLETGEVFFNGMASELTTEDAALALDNGFGLEVWHVDFEYTETKEATFAQIERLASLGVQRMTLDIYRAEDVFNVKYDL